MGTFLCPGAPSAPGNRRGKPKQLQQKPTGSPFTRLTVQMPDKTLVSSTVHGFLDLLGRKKKGLRRGGRQWSQNERALGTPPLCFTATWSLHSYADNALRQESCAQDLKQLLKAQQGLTLRTAVRGGLVRTDPEPQEVSAKERVDSVPSSRTRWPWANELQRTSSWGVPHRGRVFFSCHPNLTRKALLPSQYASWHSKENILLLFHTTACIHLQVCKRNQNALSWLTSLAHRRAVLQHCWKS